MCVLALTCFAFTAISIQGATHTWDGNGGNLNWNTAGNWGGTAPTSATTTDLIFAGTNNVGAYGNPLNLNIASPFLLNSMTFSSGGGAFCLGGNALRFQAASNTITQSSSSAISIANNINAPSTNSQFTINLAGNGSGVLTLGGIIAAGTGARDYAIVKTGSSTFALTGNNTYAGGTTINGGTLSVNSATSLGATGGALTLNAGTLEVSTGYSTSRAITVGNAASTFQIDPSQTFTVTSAIGGTGTLNKTGTGTMVLSGNNTYSNGTNVSAGTLQISASERLLNTGTLTVSGGIFSVQTFSETVGAVTLTSGSITGSGAGTLTGSSYGVQSGSISAILNGTAALTKTTSGTVTLSGANTYSGGTNINGGTLALSSFGAIGSIGTISFAGGTLQYSASNTTDYSARFSGGVNQAYSIDTNGQNVTLATALTSSGGSLTKLGLGILTLSGAETYANGTTVNDGILQISLSERLANIGALIVSGGAFDVQTFSETVGAVSLISGSITGTGTGTLTGSSYALQDGTVSAILGGTAALTKTTSGTVTLSGANTYTGTTTIGSSGGAEGGTLVLSGSGKISNATTTVYGGTLNLNGTNQSINNLALGGGAFGTTANVTLGAGNLNLGNNITYSAANNANGAIISGGTLNLNGSRTFTVHDSTAAATDMTVSSVIANGSAASGLTKTGAGVLALTGANTFTGTTTISNGTLNIAASSGSALGSTSAITINAGGRLSLGADDQINNTASMALAGGTFAKGDFSEGSTSAAGIGTLTLTGSDSHLDFGIGAVGTLSFASFSPGTETVVIDNWTGIPNTIGTLSTDRLIFAADQTLNLPNFLFTGFVPGAIEIPLGNGLFEVIPLSHAPEPSATSLVAIAALGAVVWSQRRRWRCFLFRGGP